MMSGCAWKLLYIVPVFVLLLASWIYHFHQQSSPYFAADTSFIKTTQIHRNATDSATCQVEAFIQSLNKAIRLTQEGSTSLLDDKTRLAQDGSTGSADETSVDFSLLDSCHNVFYNAVPKCGSRSLYTVFEGLALAGNHTIYKGSGGGGMGMNIHKGGANKVNRYIKLNDGTLPTFRYSHVFFVDLIRRCKHPPVMVNIIRDPVEQVLSIYEWLTFGDEEVKHAGANTNQLDFQSLDDCIEKHGVGAQCIKWNRMPLPYFSGDAETIPSQRMLQKAKWNVENTYLLVGVLEDFKLFLSSLEILLPHLFTGSVNIYQQQEQNTAKYKTKNKRGITEKTRSLLQTHLTYNIDFYQFVRQRFYKIASYLQTVHQNR